MASSPSKRVTAEQIAARLELSPTTVSLVLNGRSKAHRIPDRTAERVFAAAREMNYRPNPVARQLAGKRSNAVGVLINANDVVDARLIQEMEMRAAERGLRFIIGHVVGARERITAYLDDFRARGVDGIVSIFHNHPDYSSAVLPELAQFENVVFYERPLVVKGRFADPCYVEADFPAVARLSAQHLIERGRRRIGLMLTDMSFPYAKKRRQAHLETLAAAGLKADDSLIWVLNERTSARWMDCFTPELAMRVVQDLVVGQGTDAIVAVNDLYAARLLAAIRQSGRRVPDDVAVVGCDDLEIGALVDPPLTTVRLYIEKLAEAMTSLLFELLDKGTVSPDRRSIVIPPTLVVRAST